MTARHCHAVYTCIYVFLKNMALPVIRKLHLKRNHICGGPQFSIRKKTVDFTQGNCVFECDCLINHMNMCVHYLKYWGNLLEAEKSGHHLSFPNWLINGNVFFNLRSEDENQIVLRFIAVCSNIWLRKYLFFFSPTLESAFNGVDLLHLNRQI